MPMIGLTLIITSILGVMALRRAATADLDGGDTGAHGLPVLLAAYALCAIASAGSWLILSVWQ